MRPRCGAHVTSPSSPSPRPRATPLRCKSATANST
uniref:Uncharacterized protein n=1 Tax=Arundo donax TaxID=35708 RepID=A0A0A9BHU4_ARUDO